MKYLKELEYYRAFHERTRFIKHILEQEQKIEKQRVYIKYLEELLTLHDMPTENIHSLTLESSQNGVIEVEKFFNNYEVFLSKKTNTKDKEYVNYYVDQYKHVDNIGDVDDFHKDEKSIFN